MTILPVNIPIEELKRVLEKYYEERAIKPAKRKEKVDGACSNSIVPTDLRAKNSDSHNN
jgi:hypothetical protein